MLFEEAIEHHLTTHSRIGGQAPLGSERYVKFYQVLYFNRKYMTIVGREVKTINPYREFVASISATEFEKYCLEILNAYAESEALKDFCILHNQKVEANDGEYQIDIIAEFVALSVNFKVIVECKRYTRQVEREKIIVLADKVRSLGAHKGILISTSGFQSGATEYARQHGIALLQIFDKYVMHIQASSNLQIDPMLIEFINQCPEYYAYQWNTRLNDFPDKQIYPSENMLLEIKKKIMTKMMKKKNKFSEQ